MAHRRPLVLRAFALLLLAGFLTHSGDGLMAALCHPEMMEADGLPAEPSDAQDDGVMELSVGTVAQAADPGQLHEHGSATPAHGSGSHGADDQGDHHHDHEGGGDTCPFGLASLAVCGGAATAPAPPSQSGPGLVGAELPFGQLNEALDTLFTHQLFRPPRV